MSADAKASPVEHLTALILAVFVVYVLGWAALVSIGAPLLSIPAGIAGLLLAWRVTPPRGAEPLRWAVAVFGVVMVVSGIVVAIL